MPGTVLGSEGTAGTQTKPRMNRTDRQHSRRWQALWRTGSRGGAGSQGGGSWPGAPHWDADPQQSSGSWSECTACRRQRKQHWAIAGTIQEKWTRTWKRKVDQEKNEVAGLTSSRLSGVRADTGNRSKEQSRVWTETYAVYWVSKKQ